MWRRVMRGLAVSAIAVAILIAITLVAIHTNPVQSRILQWSVGELERRFDLDLVADDLHYNLATRRVVLTNVRLAAHGHRDNPFFTANAVAVKLPWAAYRGRLRFDEIGVDTGRVTITRDVNGISNLPPGRGRRDPNLPPRRIDARALTVRQLDFLYRDYQRDIEIRTPRIRTDLTYQFGAGAKGPIAIEHDLVVRVRDRRVGIKPVTGEMIFDGSNVELAGVRLDTTEGDFTMAGTIERSLDRPTLDLTFRGTADIAQASRWTSPPIDLSGAATIDAVMKGAPTAFVLDAQVVAERAVVGAEKNGVRVSATARLTPNGLTVSRSKISPATGGEIHATADVAFGAAAAWWVNADWQGLDAATAFRLAETRVLPFGASLAGTARLDRKAGEPFSLEIHNVSTPRSAHGTAPLQGEVEFFVAGGRWRANQRHRLGGTRVDGSLGGIWNRQSASRSTFDGHLQVTTGNAGEAARYAALFGLQTPAIVQDAVGPVDAEVKVTGIFTEPRFMGSARSPGVDVPAIGKARFSANFDASEQAVEASAIEATVGSTQVRGDVRANLVSRALEGSLALETPSASGFLTALPAALRLEGPLTGTAVFGGTVDRPQVTADLSGTSLTLGGQPVDSLVAKALVVDGEVNVESLTLKQGEGELRVTGRYTWGPRTYTVDVNGHGLAWRGTLARLGDAQARFAVKFSGAGSIDRPVGEGAIEFDVAGGLAGDLISRGVVNVRLNGDAAVVTGQVPSLGAFVSSTIVPRDPFPYDAVVVMNRVDLQPVIALSGLEQGHVKGTASLSATARGRLSAIAESEAFINLQDIQADAAGVPVRLGTPARLSWDGRGLTIDALEVGVGQGRLMASGRLGEGGLETARWQATFKGELGDLVKIGRPFGVPPELEGYGPVAISWQSTGGLDRSTASVQLTGGSLGWGELPAVRDLMLDAAFDGTTLEVKRLTGKWQDGGIEATASIPRAVLEARATGGAVLPPDLAGFAKLRVVALTEDAAAPWLSPAVIAGIDGRVSATLDARIMRASLEGINGTITFDEADFTLAGVRVAQTHPSILDIQGGIITAKDVTFDAGGSPLTLTGTARLVPTDKQVLDLALRGTADLKIISAFAPTVATEGTAKVSLGIGGALNSPVFSGRIDVAGTEVVIRDPRVVISELSGTIALDGKRVLFDSLSGSMNGGQLTLDGGFLLEGFTPSSGGLTMQVQRASLEYPQGLQSEADALVTLRPGPAGWSLAGDVRVERSVYNETISLPALIAARRTRPPSIGGGQSWLDQLRLNLFVFTQEDLRLDNNYGRLEAGAALRVAGTVNDPSLAGRVTLREGGEVYLGGNTFHVERGSVSFANPTRIVPEFDILLRTQVSGTDLTLTLEGPLDRLETEVRSNDPEIDSREAMALLFGGFESEDAVALLSAELLGATGRAIGLDTLRVERGFDTDEFRADPGLIANETDPSTRLTLSKRLRPDVELILSQSLRESGGLTAIVSYKPRRNVEVRLASRDNLDRSVALRHEITFGGSAQATAATGSDQPVISSVTISGDPRRPTEELLAAVGLEAGDRFDFHDWQRDLDELREIYHDQRFYEVRVHGTRQVSEDGQSVRLDYRIQPGAQSELVIEGHALEPGLERDLREAWMRTIFDRFLLEEIKTRIARHLIEEDVVGSTVDAVVAETTGEKKVVRVTVKAGTQVSKRIVRYAGNRTFDADRLDRIVTDAGLDVDGWREPGRIADALEAFYRDEGFLSVTVKTEEPRVDGQLGVLPAMVDEGRRFTIAAIAYPGVSPNRLPDVVTAAGLDLRVPFVTAELDAARERVEEYYAGEGFNAVQIEVEPEPDLDAGTVTVTIAVLEGVQQVLRDVRTEGATRTREGVILRALRLRVGEPVDLADWSQARKRLYDTNVFRQVDLEPVPMEPTTADSAAGIQPVRAVVRVVEYPVWRLRYGAQFNDETAEVPDPDGDARLQSLGILADLQNQNLFGLAVTGGIAGRYERDRQAGSLFTSNSSFFGLPIRSSGFIFTSRQRFFVDEDFTTIDERVGLSAEQRWRPNRDSELIWSYRFERSHVFDPDPSPFLPVLDQVTILSRLNAAMLMDRRNDPSDPSSGWFTSANYEQSLELLGSAYANAKVLLQQSFYRGVGRMVLAARAQLGSTFGEQALVRSQRFLLGGATTVRGYAEDALGPRDAFGLPTGGDALLSFNGELRFPVRGWVQGVGFIDAGNVFATRGDLSFRDLAVGYGIGLRLASPYAMLRVDFGLPSKIVGTEQSKRGRWYFGIGHIF